MRGRHGARAIAVATLVGLSTLASATASAIPAPTHVATMPVPTGSAAAPSVAYDAVACRVVGACTAVGAFTLATAPTRLRAVVDVQRRGTWQAAHPLPLPAGASSSASSTLAAVSCPQQGACLAVGSTSTAAGDAAMLVTQVAGRWGTPSNDVPVPTGSVSSTLQALWCAGTGSCLAVGSYRTSATGAGGLFSDAQRAGAWSPSVVLPSPHSASAHGDPVATGLSCTSVDSCALVGTIKGTHGGEGGFALLERTGHWATSAVPIPVGTYRSTLAAVSCRGATCLAVGGAGPTSPYGLDAPYSVQFERGRWQQPRLLAWSFAAPFTSGGALSGVSCTAPLRCVAAGTLVGPAFGAVTGGDVPVAFTLAGPHWSMPAIAGVPRSSVGAALAGLTCPSATSCEATGWSVTARNVGADGGGYPFSNVIVPVASGGRPSAPIGLSLRRSHGVVTAEWAPPVEYGGSPITSYLVVARARGEIPVVCVALTDVCALHGVVPGHTYKVDVTATNAAHRVGPTTRATVPL